MTRPPVNLAETPRGRFRRALVRSLPAWAIGGMLLALIGHALAAELSPVSGVLGSIGRGLFTVLSLLLGLVLGVAVGVLGAVRETLALALAETRELYGRMDRVDDVRQISLDALPARYDEVAGGVTSRLPLPGFGRRMLHRWLRRVLLENFVADARARGRTAATAADVRHWLLGQGLDLAARGVREQLGLWRMLLIAALLLLGALPLLLLLT